MYKALLGTAPPWCRARRIVRGSVVPVVLRNDGWTKSVTTANAPPQPMCGETLSDAVVVERRNGSRRLRVNDDDDDYVHVYRLHVPATTHYKSTSMVWPTRGPRAAKEQNKSYWSELVTIVRASIVIFVFRSKWKIKNVKLHQRI